MIDIVRGYITLYMGIINEQTESLRVAFYIRVSTEEQVEKYGKNLQREALDNLANTKGKLENGKPVMVFAGEEHVYIDDGISGTTPHDERPGFARLKENIIMAPEGEKPFDVVAVYKIDRFARRLKVLLEIIDFFEDKDIKFISANESIDTSTPFGRAILGIIGIIAELERDTIQQRTQGGREQAAKGGTVMGANAPYGYRKNESKHLAILENQSLIVQEIFDMFTREKMSAYEIAKKLKERNIPIAEISSVINKKKQGKQRKIKSPMDFWRAERIRYILSNEVYIGRYYYEKTKNRKRLDKKDWKLSERPSPRIIDDITFERAQELLAIGRHQKIETQSEYTYLLSGLLKCDCCFNPEKNEKRAHWIGDRKEIVRSSKKYTYYYKCGKKTKSKNPITCSTIPINADELENYIVNFVKTFIKNPVDVFEYQQSLKSTGLEIKNLKKKRNDLAELLNGQSGVKDRLREQHKAGYISMAKLKEETKLITQKELQYQIEIREIDYKISQNTVSQEYLQAFEVFSEKYKKMLDNVGANRKGVYSVLHNLIEEIIVFSRPVNKEDKIAGKQKKDQMIPFKLHIRLKLPQRILQELPGVRGENGEMVGAQGLEPWTSSV